MAYDNAEHLFAVLGPNEVAQINPTTGAIVTSISTLPITGSAGASGLAFDPSTGNLFVTDYTNNLAQRGVYVIPINLSSATLLPSTAGLFAYGLTADGNGDLYIAGDNISGNKAKPSIPVPSNVNVAAPRHLGNFPQALCHIALINAAFEFMRASIPGQQRTQYSPRGARRNCHKVDAFSYVLIGVRPPARKASRSRFRLGILGYGGDDGRGEAS